MRRVPGDNEMKERKRPSQQRQCNRRKKYRRPDYPRIRGSMHRTRASALYRRRGGGGVVVEEKEERACSTSREPVRCCWWWWWWWWWRKGRKVVGSCTSMHAGGFTFYNDDEISIIVMEADKEVGVDGLTRGFGDTN